MGVNLAGTIRPRRPYRLRPSRFVLPSLIVIGVVLLTLYPPRLAHYIVEVHTDDTAASQSHWEALDSGLRRCAELTAPAPVYSFPAAADRNNPRWNALSGQSQTVVLRNATLFDGDEILSEPVDILFEKGVIRSLSAVDSHDYTRHTEVRIHELNGLFVTPGLVDLHSHHLLHPWPRFRNYDDTNEVNDATGPLTPFVRAIDGIKPYDIATTIIASGGITSSLILPGSANIMGGEGVIVKNVLRSGEHGEETVEELFLEHGIPKESRRRYMKMACGENPRRVYHHTRMGNAWVLRQHLARAKDLLDRQDAWCASAEAARRSADAMIAAALLATGPTGKAGLPEALELDSTVAILRGKIGVNIHCYEQEDFEDMLLHSEEFGFRIQAFHHALSAWKVPELIKRSGQNITVATFADFSLYKKEGYDSSLKAGKILAEHGVPVAYKSDHVAEDTNAKYLLSQAATAHYFGLPELQALQSVTSVPARSLEVHHRIGFVKAGYDADLVVWDSHPLSVGATPLQVYIDGKPTLESTKTRELQEKKITDRAQKPKMRSETAPDDIQEFCLQSSTRAENLIITGITRSYLDLPTVKASGDNLTMVIDSGKISCLGRHEECISSASNAHTISLQNGYVAPGLTTVSTGLGLVEIEAEGSTADGSKDPNADPLDPDNLIYAKYGVHPEGRAFERARIGGVTRSITIPVGNSFLGGVSVGIKTDGKSNPLNGGIFKDEVAVHFVVGQDAKGSTQTPTVSSSIVKLRKILSDSKGKDSIYGKATDGKIPVIVHSHNKFDILQLIKIKNDYPKVNLIIFGAAEAPAVANELVSADIPIIFTTHNAPTEWETKDLLVGPPLTVSPVQVLAEANVTFALALKPGHDWHTQNLLIEASWAGKDAGLSAQEAVDLVSTNINKILLSSTGSSEKQTDFVIYEGNPLEYGANVVLVVDGDDGRVVSCWPDIY